MALRVRGKERRRDLRAVSVMREKIAAGQGGRGLLDMSAPGDAGGTYNVSTPRLHRGRRRRQGGQSTATERVRRKSGARRIPWLPLAFSLELHPRGISSLYRAGRRRLHVLPRASFGHRHGRPQRVESAHGRSSIFLGAAVQSGGREAAVARRILAAMAHAAGACAARSRLRRPSGWCMATGLTKMTTTGVTRVVVLENGEIRESRQRRRSSPWRGFPLDLLKGGDGAVAIAGSASNRACSRERRTPIATSPCSIAAGGLVIAGQGGRCARRPGPLPHRSIDDGAALRHAGNAGGGSPRRMAPAPKGRVRR